MEEQTPVEPRVKLQSAKRGFSWRPIVLVLVAIIVAGGVGSSLWKIKHKKFREAEPRYNVLVKDSKSEQEADANRKEYIKCATKLRNRWRPWALKHQSILSQMLNGKGENQNAFAVVYDAIPSMPKEAGMPFRGTDLDHVTVDSFTWQMADKYNSSTAKIADPEFRAKMTRLDARHTAEEKSNFARFHDIIISDSVSKSLSTVSLWASGRITETFISVHHVPGKPVFVPEEPVQIQPPFDFLDERDKR